MGKRQKNIYTFSAPSVSLHTRLFVLVQIGWWVATQVTWEHITHFPHVSWNETRFLSGSTPSLDSKFVHNMLRLLKFKHSSSSHNAQRKMCSSSSSWVLFERLLRPTSSRRCQYSCLAHFWCTLKWDGHIRNCPNNSHQGWKRTLVWFRQVWKPP